MSGSIFLQYIERHNYTSLFNFKLLKFFYIKKLINEYTAVQSKTSFYVASSPDLHYYYYYWEWVYAFMIYTYCFNIKYFLCKFLIRYIREILNLNKLFLDSMSAFIFNFRKWTSDTNLFVHSSTDFSSWRTTVELDTLNGKRKLLITFI